MTESFEDAMAFARKISDCEFGEHPSDSIREWCEMHDCGTCTACLNRLLDRLKRAHDHELEQTRKSEYHRGYEDGRRSMDAEHYAVALRLRALPLDGDTQENLAQIARAIWHSDFGWTQGACKALRDELVRLLGGVSERPHTTSTYDVLGNERHKAVCRLRHIRDCLKNDSTCNSLNIADAIGAKLDVGDHLHESICDRLIYLLGGDVETSPNDDETSPNDGPTSSITDELREFKGRINAGLTPEMVLALRAEINCIADRIDEQFDRICQQQEDVLQQTIDGAGHRLKDADKQRDELTHDVEMWRDRAEYMRMERDELQAKLDEAEFAIANWREREKSFDESERERENLIEERDYWRSVAKNNVEHLNVINAETISDLKKVAGERDELRERLDRVADALRGVERGTISAWEAADEVCR